MNEYDVMP